MNNIELFKPCVMFQPQAKTLLKKLQSMRSPLTALMEQRIVLIERCQTLQHRKVKQIPRAELTSHVDAVQRAKIELPFRVRLDLFEVRVDFQIHDIFEMPPGSKDVAPAVQSLVSRFCWWGNAVDPLDELCLKSKPLLEAAKGVLQVKRAAGTMTDDELAEAVNQSYEAWPGLAFTSFYVFIW